MNCIPVMLIIICFLSENSLINSVSGDTIVSVTTNNGVINGQTNDINGIQVNEYLGIPFAEPPIGDLRFKKPVPVNNWTTPIDATQLPNPCYQIPLTDTFLNTNFSEDCLYLNIWQPISNDTNNCSKAVVFFIHGGILIEGSSSEYQFQGQILSSLGDVVLVTVNYRLNVFGFFYTGTSDAPGNVGLWDHILALKWVRDNIGYFCGDPNQITIIGHSGGSEAVSIHVLSPVSRPLYKQAVLMSGALLTIAVATDSVAKQQWLNGAKILGCANQNDTSFNPEIIDCMRNINTSLIINLIFIGINQNISGFPPLVTIDGCFLPDSPHAMLESGDFKKDINLMIGTVADEAQDITASQPGYGASPGNFTYEQSYANCTTILSSTPNYGQTLDVQQACDLYFAEISPHSADYELLRRATIRPIGDYYVTCAEKLFARSVAKHGNNHTNVYEYFYNSCLGSGVYFCAEWMCPCHGSDLTEVFGLPFIYYSNYTDAQRNESERMIEFFSHFAKYGYPSQQNGIAWPKYYLLNRHVVTPYLYIEANKWKFDYGLKITECYYLWEKYLYFNL